MGYNHETRVLVIVLKRNRYQCLTLTNSSRTAVYIRDLTQYTSSIIIIVQKKYCIHSLKNNSPQDFNWTPMCYKSTILEAIRQINSRTKAKNNNSLLDAFLKNINTCIDCKGKRKIITQVDTAWRSIRTGLCSADSCY